LQVITYAVLKLLGEEFLLIEEDLYGLIAARSGHRLGQDVGKTGQEVDVVLIILMQGWAIDFQNAVGRAVERGDDDIYGGNDAVLLVEIGGFGLRCYAQARSPHPRKEAVLRVP
jgi:hypothetical protein